MKETTNHKGRVNAPPSTPPDPPPDFEEIWPYIKDMAPARMERVLELIAKGTDMVQGPPRHLRTADGAP